MRVRAPELRGRAWLNTGRQDIKLTELRGKIVLIDFWTFCCINCLHVLDELRPLEQKYGDALVVIGVHSPKFEHEKDPDALAAAVERYGVEHPVLDDPELITWRQYAAKAWPTLSVVDPEGYVVASMAGEGHAEGLTRLVEQLIAEHEAKGTLHRGEGPYVPPLTAKTALRFPGKAVTLSDGGLLVSDSSRHSLVELAADRETVIRRIGSGTRGRADGGPLTASFSEPQGVVTLPPPVAEATGYDVVIADTVNHLLRGLNLGTGEVTTIAGTGRQWRSPLDDHPHAALSIDLSSPWDVAWFENRIIIAMAGIHQLWWFDPIQRTVGVFAGTTVEALRDGRLPDVWLAQPSGLSVSPDGTRLWIVDSETSALRVIEHADPDGGGTGLVLRTVVGQGLFDFGHVDGPAGQALMQHPLGVCALPDGSVLVADTYNGAVRRYADGTLSTVEVGLAEPSDILLDARGEVVVVESAAHRLISIAADGNSSMNVGRHTVERPPSTLRAGEVSVEIIFSPAPGQKLDETYGPATRLEISASPPELLLGGGGITTGLSRRIMVNPEVSQGVLQVIAQAATCDIDATNPACHLTRQDWGVPIRVSDDGDARLPLVLRGLDA